MKIIITTFVLSILITTSSFAQNLAADLVVTNANVRTLDSAIPRAQAFAVKGRKIFAVGSVEEIQKFIAPNTKVIDAGGRLVIPGFNDAHVHFLDGGTGLSGVDLRDAKTPEDFIERIRKFAATQPKGRWIINGNWDHENWSPAKLPTAAMIDAVTPDNPVFINRLDGHMALANSVALKLAKVTKETKEVEGGVIVRDANGNPTGVLKDAAMSYVYAVIPPMSFEQRFEALEAATNYAASLGVTSVQDMSAGTDIGVYQELLRQGKLKTRVYAVSPLSDWKRWERAGVRYAFGSEMLRVGGLKGFVDGSLGSTTAWFFAPYLDDPKSTGLPSDEMPEMLNRVMGADKAGLQVMVHAIGDRANDELLTIFEKTEKANGLRDRRFRVEHAQHLNDKLIKRFAANKVVASMQPYHAIDDGRWAWKRLDNERLKGTYAFRTILDNGGLLAFGTDWYVAPLNPLWGIYAAVTRRTLDGKNPGGWFPAERLTVEEAVRAYTIGSAYAEFQETEKGTLAKGMLADFIVLSDDIFAIDPIKIENVKVLTTVTNGKVVFQAKQ